MCLSAALIESGAANSLVAACGYDDGSVSVFQLELVGGEWRELVQLQLFAQSGTACRSAAANLYWASA